MGAPLHYWLRICQLPEYQEEQNSLDLTSFCLGLPGAASGIPCMRIQWLCRTGTEDWERLVPQHVRDQIKSLHLLGYTSQPRYKLPSGNGSREGNGKPANGVAKEGAAAGAA